MAEWQQNVNEHTVTLAWNKKILVTIFVMIITPKKICSSCYSLITACVEIMINP